MSSQLQEPDGEVVMQTSSKPEERDREVAIRTFRKLQEPDREVAIRTSNKLQELDRKVALQTSSKLRQQQLIRFLELQYLDQVLPDFLSHAGYRFKDGKEIDSHATGSPIVDLGCGDGSLTFKLHRMCLLETTIIAISNDTERIMELRQRRDKMLDKKTRDSKLNHLLNRRVIVFRHSTEQRTRDKT